jgi:poly(3-hydroxybutyrate) depolymerase
MGMALSLRRLRIFVCLVLLAGFSFELSAQKVLKQPITFDGKSRTYYLFVPQPASAEPVPLVVLLHGSGRDGTSLTGPWQSLARKEGFAIVGPDAIDHAGWDLLSDGPDYLHDVIEAVLKQTKIDSRRVYLFGHSAGAHQALALGLLESEYFAAVAVHAGILSEVTLSYAARAQRKIPFALWQGLNDATVPPVQARRTRDALVGAGFSADLTEMKGHTHDYYGSANEINAAVWTFFQKHRLTSDPVYQQHRFVR